MIASLSTGPAALVGVALLACFVSCGGDSADTQLRILVSNDDGVDAEGIDALVRGLLANPDNAIIVSAPAAQASGTGDSRIGDDTFPCTRGTGMAMPAATASGYDADVWAVDGCPADAVLYGLDNLYPDRPPHIVIAGINAGQNVGLLGPRGAVSQLSGTVGAAKTAACSGVPAVASSQGESEGEFDYESGVVAVLAWLEENRSGLLAGDVELEDIQSINIPTCQSGTEIRGTVEVPLGTEFPEGVNNVLQAQDCASMLEAPQDDLEAFIFGFVAVTPVPSNSSNTCDKLQ